MLEIHPPGSSSAVLLPLHSNAYVVGFGKAVWNMVTLLADILGGHMQQAMVSLPVGNNHTKDCMPLEVTKIVYKNI